MSDLCVFSITVVAVLKTSCYGATTTIIHYKAPRETVHNLLGTTNLTHIKIQWQPN